MPNWNELLNISLHFSLIDWVDSLTHLFQVRFTNPTSSPGLQTRVAYGAHLWINYAGAECILSKPVDAIAPNSHSFQKIA